MNSAEQRPRLDSAETEGATDGDLAKAIHRFAAAAVRKSSLDAPTTELVRLRCAEYHDCRVCSALRLSDAIEDGLGEEEIAKIANYETSDLGDRQKAALRFTDAMIIDPGSLDGPSVADVRRHFSTEEVVEMAFDIMKWSDQKFLVAFRLEAPWWGEGTAEVAFDEAGDPVLPGR